MHDKSTLNYAKTEKTGKKQVELGRHVPWRWEVIEEGWVEFGIVTERRTPGRPLGEAPLQQPQSRPEQSPNLSFSGGRQRTKRPALEWSG